MNETRKPDGGRTGSTQRRGWRGIFRRVAAQIVSDRVGLVAAGVSFYFLLALFPAMAAFVAIFGYFSDPVYIASRLELLQGIVPEQGLELVQNQLVALASQDRDALSYSFLVAFAFSFWSANSGVKALFQALNIAYGETEKRSFLLLNLLAFAFTFGSMVVAVMLITLVGILPTVFALLDPEVRAHIPMSWLRWPVLIALSGGAIATIYRFGPSHELQRWFWFTWGGCMATVVWIAASVAFSYYLENFANYNATYGSLGAVIGFLLWVWLSTVIVIIGGKINAEMERRVRLDGGGEA